MEKWDVYEGDWINGERTGKGKYTWKDGMFTREIF